MLQRARDQIIRSKFFGLETIFNAAQLEHLDKWIAAQNDPAIDRLEAIRRLVEIGLKAKGK